MSSKVLANDAMLLTACGAQPSIIARSRIAEVIVHAVNSLIWGIAIALVSDIVVSAAAGLPVLYGFSLIPAVAISIVGTLILGTSMLVPTLTTLAGISTAGCLLSRSASR